MATNVQPEQFKLFMTGVEWQGSVTHSNDGPVDTVWREKTAQSKSESPRVPGAGVYRSIKTDGYKHDSNDPPTIVLEDSPNGKNLRKIQSEGHHRVAAAAALERETGQPVYIPTNYVDTSAAGRRARHGRRA